MDLLGAFRSLIAPPPPAPAFPFVPVLTAKHATELYGMPDGDPHSPWAKGHIVYCGGGGRAELAAMPGVPPHLWFAVHRRGEPKLRKAFAAAQRACPTYKVRSAGCWVYRHQRHDPTRPLSNHSWGAAVDVDAADNASRSFATGNAPRPWSPAWRKFWPAGLPQAWVEGFLAVGGIGWGGSWSLFVDPMHFEVYDPD